MARSVSIGPFFWLRVAQQVLPNMDAGPGTEAIGSGSFAIVPPGS
jgi:hypothetical protein